MTEQALEALKAGDLSGAIKIGENAARQQPAKSEFRVFLFQLYAVRGSWDRALRQLNIVSDLDPATEMMASSYRQLMVCEGVRREVFEGTRAPVCFGKPPDWFGLLVEALRHDGNGEHVAAKSLRDSVFEQADTTSGAVNGAAFEWIADGDERLGPLMEAMVNGRYFWIPFDRIKNVTIEAPADLRDMVWLPASFKWANDGTAVGFIPSRYVGSEASSDELIALSRKTDWQQMGDGSWCGLGQKIYATNTAEMALFDCRDLSLDCKTTDLTDTDG